MAMDGKADATTGSRADRADSLERMSQELGRLPSRSNMPLLAYLLEMATEEAAALRGSGGVRLAPQALDGRAPRRFTP